MFNIIFIILISVLTSIFYHAGGLSQDEPYWIPKWMRHTWVRDWICPLFCLLPMFISRPSWLFVLAYGAMGGAFTTYWKYKGNANFWLSGFIVGLTCLPLIFCSFAWWRVLLRAFVIAIWWGFWSDAFDNDHWEEHGRGFLAGIFNLIF